MAMIETVSLKNGFVSPSGTIIYQPFLADNSQLMWPKVYELWEIIGDSIVANVFHSVPDNDVYILAIHYFYTHF